MPQRTPMRAARSAPAELLAALNLGYNGYTDPTLTNPRQWAAAANVFSGAFGFIQRARWANIVTSTTPGYSGAGLAFTTLKYYALPTLSSYLIGDNNGKLWSFDSGAATPYTAVQRLNPYIDPLGSGSATLAGPWSRETLQNTLYEMNGVAKQSGRGANAATVEGWGLDAPDTSPQVIISVGSSVSIVAATGAVRSNNIVTITTTAVHGFGGGQVINIAGVTDTSFNGVFTIVSTPTTTSFTYAQMGQNVTSGGGTASTGITKSVGRSYAYAWENANKPHVSAPSPATQFIAYANQNGNIQASQVGTVTVNPSVTVTGTGTQFTSAWIGRHLWAATTTPPGDMGRIVSVQSATQLTLAAAAPTSASNVAFQVFDPQATHIRLYATSDGGATYFRIARNVWNPQVAATLTFAGLQFSDFANSEPPNFPFTSETSQLYNVPPPVGAFVNEYQGRLCVFGVSGTPQTFFYSNSELTNVGLPQESFAPLNQVTLPIQNSQLKGWIEFPGSAIIWSDKQDMFRMTGLLTDNTTSTGSQIGATITRLPYGLGCASPFAVDLTPLGCIWLTPQAEIWLYTDRYAPRNVGRPVQDVLNSISPASLGLARAKYYHTNTRNWFVLAVAANGATSNNTLLICDLDLLASNGSPSFFLFDMATNHPSWYKYNIACPSLEVMFEQGGAVRLFTGATDLVQDADFQSGVGPALFGTEVTVPNSGVTLHAWGNDSAHMLKRPSWVRFNTNRDPATQLVSDGWTFQVLGIDDDFYTFVQPLVLTLTPGTNDSTTLGGNPSLGQGEPFRHSPELYRIGGVNFVMGRRLKFVVNFPSIVGVDLRLRSIQIGFGPSPPR